MRDCHSIKYLFSPLMGKLLPNLKEVKIHWCDGMEEVVSNGNDEMDDMDTSSIISTHTNTTSFPHLEYLQLWRLPRLKSIDGGDDAGRGRSSAITSGTTITTTSIPDDQFKSSKVGVGSWFLCQNSKTIYIRECQALSRVFPSYVVGQLNELQELTIIDCKSMVEVFEIEGVNNDGVDNVGDDTCNTTIIPRSTNMTLLELPNLTILKIERCEVLEYVFTSSTVLESLKQLKELSVTECKAMQVIVKLEDTGGSTTKTSIEVFRHLKSLTLGNLQNLKGFFLGMNHEFQWPSLEKVEIYGCPKMMNLTSGHSITPKLNYMHTALGKHTLECGLNFHSTNATHQTQLCMSSTPDMIELLQFPCSFSNLVEVDAQKYDKLLYRRVMFPCNELLNLKNLEKLYVSRGYDRARIEEVFEVVEAGTNDDDVNIETQESVSVVVFEKLKEVTVEGLNNLRHMWKSKRWMVLKFPNLTKLSIKDCILLGHVFTRCMVGSLSQLQELQISDCWNMEVIVKEVEDDSETGPSEVVFPCLKSITLQKLPNLKGFCLGKEAFKWPSLHNLEIKDCPQITVFTSGPSTTPELKLINTTFGLCHATEDPNSFIKNKQQEGWQF